MCVMIDALVVVVGWYEWDAVTLDRKSIWIGHDKNARLNDGWMMDSTYTMQALNEEWQMSKSKIHQNKIWRKMEDTRWSV